MVSQRKAWGSRGLGNSEARGNRFLLGGIQHRLCRHLTDSSLPPLSALYLLLFLLTFNLFIYTLFSLFALVLSYITKTHLPAVDLEGLHHSICLLEYSCLSFVTLA